MEKGEFCHLKIPKDLEQQKLLLRSLMNVRPPRPISEEFLRIQDEYLSEEVRRKGVVDSDGLEPSPSDPLILVWP